MSRYHGTLRPYGKAGYPSYTVPKRMQCERNQADQTNAILVASTSKTSSRPPLDTSTKFQSARMAALRRRAYRIIATISCLRAYCDALQYCRIRPTALTTVPVPVSHPACARVRHSVFAPHFTFVFVGVYPSHQLLQPFQSPRRLRTAGV